MLAEKNRLNRGVPLYEYVVVQTISPAFGGFIAELIEANGYPTGVGVSVPITVIVPLIDP